MKNRLLYDSKKFTLNQRRTNCLFRSIFAGDKVQSSVIIKKILLTLKLLGMLMSECKRKKVIFFSFSFCQGGSCDGIITTRLSW